MGSNKPISAEGLGFDLYSFEKGAVPKRTIQRDLQKLVGVGLVERLGAARSATYQLSDRTHRDLVNISTTYNRERQEFQKYRSMGIAPRFSFGNMYNAVSWLIRRAFLASEIGGVGS